jgi:hypothetical protein
MSEALKPCPFCPVSIVSSYVDEVSRRWRIGCGRCGASSGIHKLEIEAVKAWNTRAADAELTAMRDAAVKLRDAAVKLRDAAVKLRDAAVKLRDAAVKLRDALEIYADPRQWEHNCTPH